MLSPGALRGQVSNLSHSPFTRRITFAFADATGSSAGQYRSGPISLGSDVVSGNVPYPGAYAVIGVGLYAASLSAGSVVADFHAKKPLSTGQDASTPNYSLGSSTALRPLITSGVNLCSYTHLLNKVAVDSASNAGQDDQLASQGAVPPASGANCLYVTIIPTSATFTKCFVFLDVIPVGRLNITLRRTKEY